MVGGESLPFIKAINFTTKAQLLHKLQAIKAGAAELAAPDDLIVAEMAEACIQEVAACPEAELLGLKKHLKKMRF